MMDPIGLAFESFDAIGKYRTTENGATIDLSGSIVSSAGGALDGTFTGVRELATKLAGSDQVRDCVATQWFRYAAGRTEEVPDGCSLTDAAGRVRRVGRRPRRAGRGDDTDRCLLVSRPLFAVTERTRP